MPNLTDQRRCLALGLRACRRNLAARSPFAFTKVYLENNHHAEFSRMHKEVFAQLEGMTYKRKARLAIAAPRGQAPHYRDRISAGPLGGDQSCYQAVPYRRARTVRAAGTFKLLPPAPVAVGSTASVPLGQE